MGLFQGKQRHNKSSHVDEAADAVETLFDDAFREEIRNYGHDYFKQVIEQSTDHFKQDLDESISRIHDELKTYMTTQLDATIAQVNTKITQQLDERLVAYDRVTKDAQDLAVQSLNRNAQALHDKYQQLSQMLQQTVATQEVLMIEVFEENKSRLTAAQAAQEVVSQTLNRSAQASREQSEQIGKAMNDTIADQRALLAKVLEENKASAAAAKDAQAATLQTLTASAQALKQQSEQLRATLEQNIANQETIMTNAFQDNMARVIEHYLLGALGDQFDMKAQLPGIIKQMDTNKQAIVDDMKL